MAGGASTVRTLLAFKKEANSARRDWFFVRNL